MKKNLKLYYEDSMDLLNALDKLAKALVEFGVTLQVLDGDEGYEEVQLSRTEPNAVVVLDR